MSQTPSINSAYFLTKQIANLQEDFGREIKNGASLFLLFGDKGVGKTRLLEELIATRFNGLRIHWVDCKESVDEANAPTDLGSALEHTLNLATNGDLIVADHFELATNKIKHQLLQSWSTDGIDKDFSLIIATGLAGLKEVRNLATRYRVNVKSFQLLPLTRIEIDDYCSSTLFPSLPPSPLLMPKQIRRALNETEGVVGKVRDVVEQQGSHITRREPPSPQSITKPLLVVFGLAIMLGLVGLAYHFMPVASVELLLLNKPGRERFELALPAKKLNTGVPEVEMDESHTSLIQEPQAVTQAPTIVEPAVVEPVLAVEATASPITQPEALSEPQLVAINKDEVDEKSKVEYLVDIVRQELYSDWFIEELKRSRDWFEAGEKSHATIQLMSIGFDSETDDTYLKYVETLQKKGVDVSKLRVYATRVQENVIFGIVFGEYRSRGAANQSLTDLPSSFRANQPFPRSLGGIWDEISQL
jgi:septal ring-binding cell division protein DamX